MEYIETVHSAARRPSVVSNWNRKKNISITLVCRNATWRFQKQVIGSRRLCFPTQLHSCHPDQNLLCEFHKSRHGSTNTKLTLWVVLVDTNAPFMKTLRISRKGAYMVCWESTMDVFSYEMTEHIPEKYDSFGSVHIHCKLDCFHILCLYFCGVSDVWYSCNFTQQIEVVVYFTMSLVQLVYTIWHWGVPLRSLKKR